MRFHIIANNVSRTSTYSFYTRRTWNRAASRVAREARMCEEGKKMWWNRERFRLTTIFRAATVAGDMRKAVKEKTSGRPAGKDSSGRPEKQSRSTLNSASNDGKWRCELKLIRDAWAPTRSLFLGDVLNFRNRFVDAPLWWVAQLITICCYSHTIREQSFESFNSPSTRHMRNICIAGIRFAVGFFSTPFSVNYVKCNSRLPAFMWTHPACAQKALTAIIFQKNGFAQNVNFSRAASRNLSLLYSFFGNLMGLCYALHFWFYIFSLLLRPSCWSCLKICARRTFSDSTQMFRNKSKKPVVEVALVLALFPGTT